MRFPAMQLSYRCILAALAAPAAVADVWDNYPITPQFQDGYNPARYLTSERDTQVGPGIESATWVIDDATFDQPSFINSFEWVGLTEAKNEFGAAYGYGLADWGIFTGDPGADPNQLSFTPIAGQSGVAYTREVLGTVMLDGFETQEFEVYRGRIDLQNVQIPAGTVWFGSRLVGDAGNLQNGGTGGRALAVWSAGNTRSIDEGFNYDGNFPPPWNRASDRSVPGEGPVDFAMRMHFEAVPEPAGLSLLAAATLFAARRSRSA